jgi:DNA invertase Pin-like site-specific DNA recombinase
MRVVGYIRVSTDKQEFGPDAQQKAIEDWCDRNKADLITCYIDTDVSGDTHPEKRPGLSEVFVALAQGADVLLVSRRDRLARNVVWAHMIEQISKSFGARVISCAGEGTDGEEGDPTSFLQRAIIDVFAEYERMVIKTRTKAALAVKRRRGELVGKNPYGYKVTKKMNPNGKLVSYLEEDAAEQEVLQRIYALADGGAGVTQILHELKDCFIPCRGKRWHETTIVRILARRKSGSTDDNI